MAVTNSPNERNKSKITSSIDRFKGKGGKRRLVEAFTSQELVLHNRAVAEKLSKIAKLKRFNKGQDLYAQGEPGKNSLYFIIFGEFDLLIKNKPVALLNAGRAVGEFPIVDPSLSYTVTIRARVDNSVIAMISEDQFLFIAEEYPEIWKNMSKMLIKRLREADKRVPEPKSPRVFIGHGRSKLWARVQVFLENDLGLNTVTFESESRTGFQIAEILKEMLSLATFAVLILTGEDETAEGGMRARQNVVHEAGLFQGLLGFQRAVMLVQNGLEQFSNVAGLQYIYFEGDNIESTFYELQRTLKREKLIH